MITGGPGTGKSTIINELIKRGYTCLEEISRQVILDAKKNGIDQLFLTNPLLFSELLLKGRYHQYLESKKLKTDIVFFDRGIPDVLAYMDFIGDKYPESFIDTCKASIYDERYEDFDQAVKIHKHLINTYQSYNYRLIDVPFDTVEKRTDFILNIVNM